MFSLTRYLGSSFVTLYLSLFILLCFSYSGSYCFETEADPSEDSTESHTDYPQKISSRTTWEKIVSFPGAVIFVPFKIIYITSKTAFDIDYEVPYVSKIADLMVSNDGNRSLLPTYGSRRGGGLKYKHKGLISERSVFDITSTIWMRNRSMQRIRFRDLDVQGGMVTAGFNAEYLLLPDERFYEIGMDSEKDGKTNFTREQISFDISIGKRFFERLNFKGVFTYQRNNILPGRDNSLPSTTDIYDDISLPGLETGIDLAGGNLGMEFDSRNHPGRPTAGWELSLDAGLLQQSRDDRFGFWESSFDIKRYVHLFYNRYMVFRIAARRAKPLPNKEIPFYYLSQIGQWNTIRGFSRSRFRDRDLLLGSVEYRWPLTPAYLHALLFVDAGKVSEDIINNISRDDYEITYGLGLIGWSHEGILIRAEIGISSERVRFNLNFN